MLVTTKAEALIAVDIVAIWGIQAKNQDFFNHNLTDALDNFDLDYAQKHQIEKAICDNLEAFRDWSNASIDDHNSATRWSLQRPKHLNPLRYKMMVAVA